MAGQTSKLQLLEPTSPESLLPDHGLWPWLLAALLVVVIVAVLITFFKRRKPAGPPTAAAIRKAAMAEATAALTGIATADAREAAVLCSLILRKFLATTTGDPALYQTHEEFIASHDALQALTPDARTATADGFSRLAALKYSPAVPAAEPASIVTDARSLLETLNQGLAA